MKIVIEEVRSGGFTMHKYLPSGWLDYRVYAADEMELFKELAIVLGVRFKENKKGVTCKQ